MRFLIYNIRYATGHNNGYHIPIPYAGFFRPTHRNLNGIIDFIDQHQPDVVGLIEVDSGSYRSRKSCQAETIANALEYYHLVETKYEDGSIAAKVPVMNKQSNALLTKEPALNHCFHYFNEGVKRLVIQAEFESVIVFIVHLSLKFRHRQYQLNRLHKMVKNAHKPVIIGGDFNTLWGSHELDLFLAATDLNNANPANFPSHPSHAPLRQIDFILHSRELTVKNFHVPDIQLSDHFPLICDFQVNEPHSSYS